MAGRLADHFGLAHLETGKLYRATALAVLDAAGDPADPKVAAESAARRLDANPLSDPRLRNENRRGGSLDRRGDLGGANGIARFPAQLRRHPAGAGPGAVLDGRDIGSVVCPDADVKLFLNADPKTRARRRVRELRQSGVAAIYGAVLQDMRARDARDAARAVAPTAPAGDAIVIDTTTLDADRVFEAAAALVERALAAMA